MRSQELLDELAQIARIAELMTRMEQSACSPEADKALRARALAAAEKNVSQWEVIEKGLKIVCARPQRCENRRCRRRRRCHRIEKTVTTLAKARARLAAEQAKWPPPPAAPPQPQPAHNKGRTEVRP